MIVPLPRETPEGIVGMASAKSNDWVYTWYKGGYVSRGTSWNLAQRGKPYPYILPSGKSPADIVGMDSGNPDDRLYTWYRDGTFSIGRSWNLAEFQAPEGHGYKLPGDYSYEDIIDLGIAGKQGINRVHAWYRNGYYSVGTPDNLAASPLRRYDRPPGASYDDIVGMAISGSDERVYTWYVAEGAPTGDLAAASWCYELDLHGPGIEWITFFPIVENVGTLGWSSKNEGTYTLEGLWGPYGDHPPVPHLIDKWPRWYIGPREKKVLKPGLSLPFKESNIYYFRGWNLEHPDDVNRGNNELTWAMDHDALGKEFLPGGSMAHMREPDTTLMSPYA